MASRKDYTSKGAVKVGQSDSIIRGNKSREKCFLLCERLLRLLAPTLAESGATLRLRAVLSANEPGGPTKVHRTLEKIIGACYVLPAA
jgi:hypothetical protein